MLEQTNCQKVEYYDRVILAKNTVNQSDSQERIFIDKEFEKYRFTSVVAGIWFLSFLRTLF